MLEAGQGVVGNEYVMYYIMKTMGWSYQDLCDCPYPLVLDILRYINTEAKFTREHNHGGS